jgi:hypothetical protein
MSAHSLTFDGYASATSPLDEIAKCVCQHSINKSRQEEASKLKDLEKQKANLLDALQFDEDDGSKAAIRAAVKLGAPKLDESGKYCELAVACDPSVCSQMVKMYTLSADIFKAHFSEDGVLRDNVSDGFFVKLKVGFWAFINQRNGVVPANLCMHFCCGSDLSLCQSVMSHAH